MFASGVVLLTGAGVTLVAVTRMRRRVRRATWLLRRTEAAISEAERAGRVRAALRRD